MAPQKVVTLSKSDILRKFRDGNWEAKLRDIPEDRRQLKIDEQWLPASGRTTLRKKGTKYLAENGDLLAFIIEYHQSDGSTRISVRALRDGDTTYVIE